MEANGYILTYPLGYTKFNDEKTQVSIKDIQNTLDTLSNQLTKLDIDGNSETQDADITNFIDKLNEKLRLKADLYTVSDNGTPDDTSDDILRVVPKQLEDDPNDTWIEDIE